MRGVTNTHRMPLRQLGNTDLWPFALRSFGRQLRDAPSDWRRSSFALPDSGGSTCSLAIRHLADVGISGPLQTGLGFFGLLNAALSALPYGWGDHDRRGPSAPLFHVLHSIQEDLGPLCYTGSPVSSRRATLDNPDSTACLLAEALISLVWLLACYDAYERSVSFDHVLQF